MLAFAPGLMTGISGSIPESEESDSKPEKEFSYQIVKNISPNLQVAFHPDLCFEFELPSILDNTHHYNHFHENESEAYFKTLFHFIISPNAP